MSRYYVVCDLGVERGRVMLGALQKDRLTLSEVSCFQNLPLKDKESIHWDVDHLYQDILLGLREVGSYDEPVESISCTAWPGDYLLFHADSSLISPTFHFGDPRTAEGRKEVLSRIPAASLFDETGFADSATSTLFQLATEKPKRLKRADHLLPVADAFNFLLSGVPWIEMSSASATQLFNPVTKAWSELLIESMHLPRTLFPTAVPAGTKLKPLRSEISKATKLEEAMIIAGCSHRMTAATMGLPVHPGESWALLEMRSNATLGMPCAEPLLNEASFAAGCANVLGYNDSVFVQVQAHGLWIIEECRKFWAGTDHGLDDGVIAHLAGSATPFESLIDLADPRFAEPGDMPLKIRAYCKETGQTEARKPGPVVRCVLESLALHYRRKLDELAAMTGQSITQLYLLGNTRNPLLNHFIANALQIPVTIVSSDCSAIGGIVVQALSAGHLQNLPEARRVVRDSFKCETILPHNAAWANAYQRLLALQEAQAVPVQPEPAPDEG